jgi:DegV family protein with EDD domain
MEKVKIVTSSVCYLPEEVIKKYDIKITPNYVRFGDNTYAERIDITDDEFYEKVRKGELPYTIGPSAGDFIKVYKPLIEEGYSIISLFESIGLSSGINAANTGKKLLGNPDIYILDSGSGSLGLGYQVLEVAKRLYDEGMSKENVIKEIPSIKDKANLFFIVKDLHYLARLGRIGKAKALLGSAIKITPLFYIRKGFVDVLEQPRTIKKAKHRMIELTKEIVNKRGLKYMSVMWGDNREEAEEYRKTCEKEFGIKVSLWRLGPVIAAHTGPQILFLNFYTER